MALLLFLQRLLDGDTYLAYQTISLYAVSRQIELRDSSQRNDQGMVSPPPIGPHTKCVALRWNGEEFQTTPNVRWFTTSNRCVVIHARRLRHANSCQSLK